MTLSNPAQYISGRTVQEQMNSLIDYVDQRAADVALDAIASDVAQVHQDMLDADADAAAAAASAAAAAGTLANAVKKTGEASQSIAGDIAVSGDLDVGGGADITGALDVTGAITGNDASLIGTVTVPTEATGTFTMKAANSTKVKNELDNYAPMVRTSGNQTIAGSKTLTAYQALINKKGNNWKGPTSTYYLGPFLNVVDTDDSAIGSISYSHDANGTNHVVFDVRAYTDDGQGNYTVQKRAYLNIEVRSSDGKARMTFVSPSGATTVLQDWIA